MLKMMRREAAALLALALATTGAGTAMAAQQLLVFTGQVTEVQDDDGDLDGSIEVGTEFTARYTVDESSVECDVSFGTNVCSGPVLELELSLGSYTLWGEGAPSYDELQPDDAHVAIWKEGPQEPEYPDGVCGHAVRTRNPVVLEGPSIEPRGPFTVSVSLIEPEESRLDSVDFFVPAGLEGWSEPALSIQALAGFEVKGVIETLTVPEPSHATLTLCAVSCLGALARRRCASSRSGAVEKSSP